MARIQLRSYLHTEYATVCRRRRSRRKTCISRQTSRFYGCARIARILIKTSVLSADAAHVLAGCSDMLADILLRYAPFLKEAWKL